MEMFFEVTSIFGGFVAGGIAALILFGGVGLTWHKP
jgi:hypothetical protein